MQRAHREDCERLRLEREEKDRRQEAGIVLLETAKALLDVAADEEAMARHVLAAARRITGSRFGCLCAVSRGAGALDVLAMEDGGATRYSGMDAGQDFSEAFRGVIDWMAERTEPVIIENPAKDPRFAGHRSEFMPLGPCLVAPAGFGGEWGVVLVLAEAPHGFDGVDVFAAAQLAGLFVAAHQGRVRCEVQRVGEEAGPGTDCRLDMDLFACMGHELRTSLNTVIGLGATALELRPSEEVSSCLATMTRTAGHLLIAMEHLRDLSQLRAGCLVLEPVDFDLPAVLDSVLATPVFQSRGEGVRFRLDLQQSAVPRVVFGDEARVRQVMGILLDCAAASAVQGEVMLAVGKEAADPDPSRWSFVIRGPTVPRDSGLDPLRPSVPDASFEEGEFCCEGMDAGLALAHGLLDLMGAALVVRSGDGGGGEYIFSLRLPPGDPRSLSPKAPWKPTGKPAKVLLVEDNEDNLKVARTMLDKLGHTVVEAFNGRQALDVLLEDRMDVVLMDLEMPEMDGIEATRRIRAGEAGSEAMTVPIVALTAHALSTYRDRCFEAGMDGFLSKPVSFRELGALLGDAGDARPPCPTSIPQEELSFSAPPSVLDKKIALERLDGDESIYAMVCNDFLRGVGFKAQRVKEALLAGDLEEFVLQAHTLKGNCGTVGAVGCMRLADSMVRAGKGQDRAEAERLHPLFERELEKVVDYLRTAMAMERPGADSSIPSGDSSGSGASDLQD